MILIPPTQKPADTKERRAEQDQIKPMDGREILSGDAGGG
jgi:hypothetical protein